GPLGARRARRQTGHPPPPALRLVPLHAPAAARPGAPASPARAPQPLAGGGDVVNPRSFRFEQQGPVATLRLDRPQAMNALTFDVYRELTDTLRALADQSDVRAVVLNRTGRAFCTGGDVREIIGPLLGRDEKALLEFTTLTCDLIRAMRALPRPIVDSLNGTVAGAGADTTLASDFRVAADTARIAFLFVKVGLAGADMGAAHL